MSVRISSLAVAAALAFVAVPASAALVTSLPGGTSVGMPVVEYFGPGPQVFGPGITWTSTNATNQGGAVFGYTNGYGFSANGFWFGFPMAGVNSANFVYGVVDSMTFALSAPTTGFGGRINWAGDNVPVTIAAFDSADNLLETYSLADSSGNLVPADTFYGIFRPQGDISKFVMTAGYIGIADIVIDGGVIPEPATWALLISGFGLVGAAARRRRVAAAA